MLKKLYTFCLKGAKAKIAGVCVRKFIHLKPRRSNMKVQLHHSRIDISVLLLTHQYRIRTQTRLHI